MFGWIPSLLHIHNINVKDRPELHLHKPNRICNNTLNATNEDGHPWKRYRVSKQHKRRQKEGKLVWLKKKVSPHSGFGCIHEMMVSGCVGVSELFVKHYNTVKLSFSQPSPPLRGAGLLQPSTDRRTAVQIQMHWAVPLQLAGHTARDPLKKWSQDCATWFFISSHVTLNRTPQLKTIESLEESWDSLNDEKHIFYCKKKVDEKENSIAAFKYSP